MPEKNQEYTITLTEEQLEILNEFMETRQRYDEEFVQSAIDELISSL